MIDWFKFMLASFSMILSDEEIHFPFFILIPFLMLESYFVFD